MTTIEPLSPPPNSLTRGDRYLIIGLLLFAIVPVLAGTARLTDLAAGGEVTPENRRFVETPLPIVIHIISVSIYALVAPFQFSPGFRRTHRTLHRRAGALLIPCGIIAATTGLWMAHFYDWPEADGVVLYGQRLIVGVAIIAMLVMAIRRLAQRQFRDHGNWMLRAYALGMGAATQVLTHLPWFVLVSGPAEIGEAPRAVLMGAGWAINAVIAEVIVHRRNATRRASI